jgi:Raf kinase inhibitor-like YbhB/YbcL family protein
MGLKLFSSVLKDSIDMPQQYTGDGDDISPPLQWEDVPEGTKSFALICDDPDSVKNVFTHWIIYNIPSEYRSLPENIPVKLDLEMGIRQGINDFGVMGYGGPCPSTGKHRYFFKLFALSAVLELQSTVRKNSLEKAMIGHILDQTQLMVMYQRK